MATIQSERPSVAPNGIYLLGDFPDADSVIDKKPLTGQTGKMLDSLLAFAGIDREACWVGNVFTSPVSRFEPAGYFSKSGSGTPKHPKFGYLLPAFEGDLQRLDDELKEANPRIIIAFGGLALWALAGLDKINDYRGTVLTHGPAKLIPTHHPHSIRNDWSLRPIVSSDLVKATVELQFPEVRRKSRTVNIVENVADMDRAVAQITAAGFCAFDVETAHSQITCISLAANPLESFVIPFWNYQKPGYHQFVAPIEVEIWTRLALILEDPAIRKLAHNATYDLTYCREHDIIVAGQVDDTMLMSHSYQIEWPKSLGFLGSIYCNEAAWKLMRTGLVKDLNKADE